MQLTVNQMADIGPVTAVDRKGNPASFDGPVGFEITPGGEGIVTIADHASGDPAMRTIVAIGTPGAAQVRVFVDADLGEGVVVVEGFVGVNVTPEMAVALNVPEGTPVDKP